MPRSFAAAILTALLIAVLAVVAWRLSFVLLLAFAGLLLAVLLRHLALHLSRHVPISTSAAVVVVSLAMGLVLALGIVRLGPQIMGQIDLLLRSLPEALEEAWSQLDDYSWGRYLRESVPAGAGDQNWNLLGTISGTVSTVFGMVANAVIVVSVAIFLASDPDLYRRGLLHMVPLERRQRAAEIMDALGRGLWRWMVGQGVAMTAVAVLSGLGLWLIGVPLALALGLIAGLLDFIPYVGPVLGAAPAILLALAQGPTEAIYAVLLFLVIQQVEGNLLMPIIQKKASSLPPVLTILAVLAFGVLFGFMGVLLATPLLLVTIILVRMIYVEDVLGDRTVAGPEESPDPPAAG